MNSKFKRAAALLCLITTFASTACGSTSSENGETTVGATDESTTAAETTARSPLYDMERKDYGGREFRIAVNSKYTDEMWVEEETGDVCNDAVYDRNLRVEDYLGVKIVPVITQFESNDTHPDFVKKVILAGEDRFDLTAVYTYLAGRIALDGIFYNWKDISGVDFSKEWWIQSANEAFSIGGNQYVAVGDLSTTTLLLSFAIYFNHRLAADYQIPNLYETVLDGGWTIDKLLNYTKDIYQDVNNNGSVDKDDQLAFATGSMNTLDAYTASFDIPLTRKNADGVFEACLDVDRMQTGIEKVYSLYYERGSYISPGDGSEITTFANGNVAFLATYINNSFTTLREMKDDYGILPYPKLDESQDDYYSNAMDNYSLLSVPKTVKPQDTEFVGTVTEALTRENHYSVIPAYYDVALTAKYARDEQSVAMLDIIMNGRQYDFSILHSNMTANYPYLFRALIREKNTNAASGYAAIKTQVDEGLKQLAEAYSELAK